VLIIFNVAVPKGGIAIVVKFSVAASETESILERHVAEREMQHLRRNVEKRRRSYTLRWICDKKQKGP
jgi:hypothetical protein